jgi:hypothetical protein
MGLKKVVNNIGNKLDEDQVRKLVKKTQVVYKAFRKGNAIFKYNNDITLKFEYVLDNDYYISIDKTVAGWRGEGAGEIYSRIVFNHMTVEFGDMLNNTFLPEDLSPYKHPIVGQIEKKFQSYNVKLGVPMTVTNITQK